MNENKEFRGKYYFLNNFYNAEIIYENKHYQNNEAAFQAMKCPERADDFRYLNGAEAKRLGRHVPLRSDWEKIKEKVMYEICLAKFTQNPELKKELLQTGDCELIEGNSWNDTYWGVCNGYGKNKLGKILMQIRAELR